jgi:hypothetical protein
MLGQLSAAGEEGTRREEVRRGLRRVVSCATERRAPRALGEEPSAAAAGSSPQQQQRRRSPQQQQRRLLLLSPQQQPLVLVRAPGTRSVRVPRVLCVQHACSVRALCVYTCCMRVVCVHYACTRVVCV